MFVDEKQQGEAQTAEQANRKLKLSEAIRIGKRVVREDKQGFLACGSGCAMGMAWIGSGRTERERFGYSFQQALEVLAKDWGRVVWDVNRRHVNGETADEIAADLEAQGL